MHCCYQRRNRGRADLAEGSDWALALNGSSNQKPAIGIQGPRRSGLGRFATDTSPDSSPESRRWRFASRKLPFAEVLGLRFVAASETGPGVAARWSARS